MLAQTCGYCRQRYVVRITTDGRGGTTEGPCPCTTRRLAGICQDCPRPVEGRPGKPLRCADHKRARARSASALWKMRNPESFRRTQRSQNRKRRTDPELIERRRARDEARRADPVWRERRKERRRAIALTEHGRVQKRESHQRYRERHPDRVAEQTRRQNARRAEAKREYMHVYGSVYGLKAPTCRGCGAEVPWGGRGRPHVHCPSCDPKSWRAAEARRAAA